MIGIIGAYRVLTLWPILSDFILDLGVTVVHKIGLVFFNWSIFLCILIYKIMIFLPTIDLQFTYFFDKKHTSKSAFFSHLRLVPNITSGRRVRLEPTITRGIRIGLRPTFTRGRRVRLRPPKPVDCIVYFWPVQNRQSSKIEKIGGYTINLNLTFFFF